MKGEAPLQLESLVFQSRVGTLWILEPVDPSGLIGPLDSRAAPEPRCSRDSLRFSVHPSHDGVIDVSQTFGQKSGGPEQLDQLDQLDQVGFLRSRQTPSMKSSDIPEIHLLPIS